MVGVEQVAGFLLLVAERARIGVHDLHQQHLRALQVIAHGDQHHPLGIGQRSIFGVLNRIARPEAAGKKRRRDQQYGGGAERPSAYRRENPLPKPETLFRQMVAQSQPGLFFENRRRFGDLDRLNLPQQLLHMLKAGAAFGALRQVAIDPGAVFGIAIAVQDDLCFAKMVHFASPYPPPQPARGSSWERSFCTARKTQFLAALVLTFSAWLISSIDCPSMWRMVKAIRSAGVSRPMACATLVWISALSSTRSGPGPVAGSCTCRPSSGSGESAIEYVSLFCICVFLELRKSRARFTAMRYSQVPKLARSSNPPRFL